MIRKKGRSKPQVEKLSFDSNFRKRSDPNETHSNNVQTDHNDKFLFCNDCNHNCLTYEPSRDGFCNCGCH